MVGVVRPAELRVRGVRATGDQDGFLHLHRIRPAGPAPAVCRAHRVYGPLDLAALRTAWAGVVARHDSLRTTFTELDGVLVRRVDPAATNPLRELAAGSATTAQWCARLAVDLPDPEQEPPVRLTLVQLDPTTHLLTLTAHRLVADDRSADIVLGELSRWYAAARTGHRPVLDRAVTDDDEQLPPGPCDLPAAPLPLDLPTGRSGGDGGAGGQLVFRWEEPLTRQLTALARAERVEPVAVIVAAFQALLHRCSRAARVAVGVTARRTGPAVGCFAGLRIDTADFTDETSLRGLLTRGRTAHRPPPFGDLVRSVAATRDLREHSLVDAVVDLAGEDSRLRLPGTAVWHQRPVPLPLTADLTLTVRRQHPTLDGELTYRTGLFTEHAAAHILAQLRALLDAALADPGAPVATLPLDDAEPVDHATVTAGDPAHVVPVPRSFQAWAGTGPDAPAIVSAGETRSYGEIAAAAAGVAAALRRTGTGTGDAVVVRMPPGAVQAAAILGAWQTGARVVCLGPGDPGERGRAALAGLAPRTLVVTGDGAGDPLRDWFRDELGGTVVDAGTLAAATPEPARTAPTDPAYVAYTSGSTGVPKGIPMNHAALAQFTGWMTRHFGIGPGSRVAQWAAPGYDASLVELFLALGSGAASYPVPDRFRGHPGKVLDWLAAEDITLFQTVPSFARALLKEIVTRRAVPPALRHLLLAGEQLSADLAEGLRTALPGVRLVNLYGPTETILATYHEITAPVHGRTPIGRAIPGRDVRVLDPHDRPCPAGVAGEIVIASPYVTPGYTGSAAGRTGAFRPPAGAPPGIGWYRTGDLGRTRWDGPLECLGRRDEQIKFHGVRLEVADIEAALAACASVSQCAVVPVTDADGLVVRLVAYVVPTAPDPATAPTGEWRGQLRRRFGAAMPPVSFRCLSGLPRTAGGKVDRRRLPSSRG